ncbi:PPC domain-containing protein [Trichodesmium erythraeum 21-75]|nr:PPC domain-containing protein [Trichodesmium erythraeum 21-75]
MIKSIDGANNLGKLSQKELKVNDKIGYRENGKRDGIDLYFFEINEEQEVDINLNKLKQNSNLRLIDEDGETVLDKSTNKGKNSEKITEVLEPGIYYVEVYAQGNAKTNYELSLSSQEVNTVFPSVLETYESGTRVGFENRVSLEIPEGWVGKQKSMFETIFEGRSFVDGQYFPFTLTSTKYPDVYVELSVRSNYLTGLIQNLANTWAIDETTYEPQGKAKVKGNQITNTYTAKNSISQEKYYVVSTVGPNDEIATVTVGGSVNKLKDYKDIANDVVESLDFPEPTDWEEFFSDHWLAYAPYGITSEGIFLYDDRSFYHIYDYSTNRFGTWDMTRKDELVIRYENGQEKVGQLDGPSVSNNIIYGEFVYQAIEKNS